MVRFWFLALLPALPPLQAAAGDSRGVTTAYDVSYRTVGDSELRLDMVQPSGAGPHPALLLIHGGAWREGSKEENRRFLLDFARRGYVAISPQYRFCPRDVFPAQVSDVKAAVRWLRRNAASLKIDRDRVGAMGFSAGGHLALMLGLTGPGDGLEEDAGPKAPSSQVQAVVSFFGPTDLAAADLPEFTRSLVRDFLGGLGGAGLDKSLAAKASPVSYATPGDAPTLLFHGTKDETVPVSQATGLAEAMTRAGVRGRIELLVGAGHGWQGEEFERTIKAALEFFDRELKVPGR